MAKWTHDTVLDQPLDYLAANAEQLLICAGQPTDRADALSKALADVAIDSSDFTKADGDVSGRKSTVGAQSGITVDTSGTADHLALISDSILLHVTTCDEQVLTQGNTCDTPAFDIEYGDPA
jgi:hypothetical protein